MSKDAVVEALRAYATTQGLDPGSVIASISLRDRNGRPDRCSKCGKYTYPPELSLSFPLDFKGQEPG